MAKFTDWLDNDAEDCGLCDPPIDAQLAINFLKDYLLGENWYVAMPESPQQVNTAIVFEILYTYSKDFRKEWKEYKKRFKEKDNG